jgi:hypothetical protein
MDIVLFILVASLIALIVHKLFRNRDYENIEDIQYTHDIDSIPERFDNIPGKLDSIPGRFDNIPRKLDSVSGRLDSVLRGNEYEYDRYKGVDIFCEKIPQTSREFNNNFFRFRDSTCLNSSMRDDAVDRVQQLYLQGNLSEVRGCHNVKIKDIFDKIVANPNPYERQCVRLPSFDNVNPDGWRFNYGTPGTQLTGDKWVY